MGTNYLSINNQLYLLNYKYINHKLSIISYFRENLSNEFMPSPSPADGPMFFTPVSLFAGLSMLARCLIGDHI